MMRWFSKRLVSKTGSQGGEDESTLALSNLIKSTTNWRLMEVEHDIVRSTTNMLCVSYYILRREPQCIRIVR